MRKSLSLQFPLAIACVLVIAGCNDNGTPSSWFGRAEKTPPPPAQSPSLVPSASTNAPQPTPVDAAVTPAKPDATGAIAVGAATETTKPFDFPRDGQGSVGSGPAICQFNGLALNPNTKVFAAGAYSGRALDYQIDQSGHQATQIDVAVNHPGGPVVLMLGAYEPTVWNIGWSKGTRISAVLVSGYNRQIVAGLPSSVPTLNSSYDNKGACGYFYVATDKLDSLNPMARRLFGRPVDMVYPAVAGRVLVGNPLDASVALETSSKTPESFREPNAPLAGDAGIAEAVAKGLLREATASDAQAWADAQPARTDLPPVAGAGRSTPPPRLYKAYVVLGPMVVPAGLYGANAVTFFVPKGVARPTGPLGHSKIYDFNTMTCAGVTCRME